MNLRNLLPAIMMALASCAPGAVSELPGRAAPLVTSLPAMKTFSAGTVSRATRSNAEIAEDFMDLAFQMESGRRLPFLTRFEGPISLRVTGPPPVSLAPDLGRLVTRLRQEAGLKISVTDSENANINVVAVPKRQMQKYVPSAACFVVPNVRDWAHFKSNRRSNLVDWTMLRRREQISIFVPADAAPQELRDCLHEEIAQALGPLNDLYRLPDSVFNDDNFHTVLTGFDMLILRAYYAPELRNGMRREEVARVIRPLLARLNPAGEGRAAQKPRRTSRAWISAMQVALTNQSAPARRRVAARQAISLAQASGWNQTRLGFAEYANGRLSLMSNPEAALQSFRKADLIFASRPEMALHRAYVAVQLAAFQLAQGNGQGVIDTVTPYINTAARYENAALLASLMMFRAEGLELIGRASEARTVRLDSLGWARYGFGSQREVNARLAEIRALNPLKSQRQANL